MEKINSMLTTIKPPICFNNSFVKLGEKFFAKLNPTPVEHPKIVKLNYELSNNQKAPILIGFENLVR